jgi:hypothetical protein
MVQSHNYGYNFFVPPRWRSHDKNLSWDPTTKILIFVVGRANFPNLPANVVVGRRPGLAPHSGSPPPVNTTQLAGRVTLRRASAYGAPTTGGGGPGLSVLVVCGSELRPTTSQTLSWDARQIYVRLNPHDNRIRGAAGCQRRRQSQGMRLPQCRRLRPVQRQRCGVGVSRLGWHIRRDGTGSGRRQSGPCEAAR